MLRFTYGFHNADLNLLQGHYQTQTTDSLKKKNIYDVILVIIAEQNYKCQTFILDGLLQGHVWRFGTCSGKYPSRKMKMLLKILILLIFVHYQVYQFKLDKIKENIF